LLGRISGREKEAKQAVAALKVRIAAVEQKVAGAPAVRVFYELDLTLFTAGPETFIDDVIGRAGGTNIASGARGDFPQLSPEDVIAGDPEGIFLADEAFGATPESGGPPLGVTADAANPRRQTRSRPPPQSAGPRRAPLRDPQALCRQQVDRGEECDPNDDHRGSQETAYLEHEVPAIVGGLHRLAIIRKLVPEAVVSTMNLPSFIAELCSGTLLSCVRASEGPHCDGRSRRRSPRCVASNHPLRRRLSR
jgi:hypothetical protein